MKKPPNPVPFFGGKLEISRKLLGAYTIHDVANFVFPEASESGLSIRAQENYRKWRSVSRPKRRDAKLFFNGLARVLGCDQTITGAMIVEANIEQFIGLLPEIKRETARQIVSGMEMTDLPALADKVVTEATEATSTAAAEAAARSLPRAVIENFREIMVRRRGVIESMSKGIEAGRINQRHYYLSPEAASTWSNLVRAEAYPTYDHCKAGLRAMVDTKQWRNAISSGSYSTAVMLTGGGAPTKDIVLINSLLREETLAARQIEYFIVDISPYMLLTSIWWLEEILQHVEGGERVELRAINHDVMRMIDCKTAFRRSGAVIFGITGGTIGNLSEAEFFQSLNEVAETGDLLIISADTLETKVLGQDGANLIEKYDHSAMRRFISPAVRALLDEFDLAEAASTAYNRVKVDLRDGIRAGLSDIPESHAVTLTIDAGGREIMLLSSTRYHGSRLIEFAERWGWKALKQVPSPLNRHFVQFLFQRK